MTDRKIPPSEIIYGKAIKIFQNKQEREGIYSDIDFIEAKIEAIIEYLDKQAEGK